MKLRLFFLILVVNLHFTQLKSDEIFNLGNTNANMKKREIAEIIKNKFLPNVNLEYSGEDQDLRSYKVDFTKIDTKLNGKLLNK